MKRRVDTKYWKEKYSITLFKYAIIYSNYTEHLSHQLFCGSKLWPSLMDLLYLVVSDGVPLAPYHPYTIVAMITRNVPITN